MNSSKVKGDKGERECAALISSLLGYPVRRRLGAGRADDVGDLDGVPNTVIQVADWKRVSQAAIVKPPQADAQREHARAGFAATFVRFRGGTWRVILTPEQWAAYQTQVGWLVTTT